MDALDTRPFQEISVTHTDGEFALWLLERAYFEADQLLRDQDRERQRERKAYIQGQLQQQQMVQMQQALRDLLASELSREIAIESGFSYSGTVIEEPRLLTARTGAQFPADLRHPRHRMGRRGDTPHPPGGGPPGRQVSAAACEQGLIP